MGGLAFRPALGKWTMVSPYEDLARVAVYSVSVYAEPNDKSRIIRQRYRDELLNIYYEVQSEYGPDYNPLWYRVWQGYIHSAHIQRVKVRPNRIPHSLSEKYQLAEVTVPYSQTMRQVGKSRWQPVYRLYYESTHWVLAIDPGPDGKPWYRIRDELLDIDYHAPAADFRLISPEEFSPISADVPPEKKRIEVSLQNQTLTAYEYEQVVLHTKISSGIPRDAPTPKEIPTKTPAGAFRIENKMPSKHMGDGNLTDDLDAYELPGVPWTSFFVPDIGVAFHGTYWHNNFGIPMSHGCINMRTSEAKWLFRWSTPITQPEDFNRIGYGTRVKVI
jgi:lipoprotein-anchoring transpeptidase ErfK/SrfK